MSYGNNNLALQAYTTPKAQHGTIEARRLDQERHIAAVEAAVPTSHRHKQEHQHQQRGGSQLIDMTAIATNPHPTARLAARGQQEEELDAFRATGRYTGPLRRADKLIELLECVAWAKGIRQKTAALFEARVGSPTGMGVALGYN